MKLKAPFTLLLAGPTSSGKTDLVISLMNDIRNTTNITKDIVRVLICYGIWQEKYNNFHHPDVVFSFHEGFCHDFEDHKPDVIILDDLMNELARNKEVCNVFTKKSHHENISVIFITQNLFHQSKEMRTMSLNSHYIILMKAPRDKQQIMTLGRQIYPKKGNLFMEAYELATSNAYGHLLIDLTSSTPDNLRLRQRLFHHQKPGYEIYSIS